MTIFDITLRLCNGCAHWTVADLPVVDPDRFEAGQTPKQAYEAFDAFACNDDEYERDLGVIRQCMERK